MKAGLLDGPLLFHTTTGMKKALILATDARNHWNVASAVMERGGTVGVCFRGTSGFGDERGAPVYVEKSDQPAEPMSTAPSTFTAAIAPVIDTLPGRPYPNPPSDAEAISAISSFLGEVQDGTRTIEVLGCRQMCAQPTGSECHVRIDGHIQKVFTLTRTADGRLEASDLGSCGD